MINYYEELPISQFYEVVPRLDKIVEVINYDLSKVEKNLYNPEITNDYAKNQVSEEALNNLQQSGSRDVATHDCNVLKFNNIQFDWMINYIAKAVNKTKLGVSGRIWYPKNGYMGWHTNNDNRGLKLYCTHARENEKSFFRYQHPISKEIITSWDKIGWNFRIFKVMDELLWHSVYSETDRISIGFTIID